MTINPGTIPSVRHGSQVESRNATPAPQGKPPTDRSAVWMFPAYELDK